jgi:hypothetical protein
MPFEFFEQSFDPRLADGPHGGAGGRGRGGASLSKNAADAGIFVRSLLALLVTKYKF